MLVAHVDIGVVFMVEQVVLPVHVILHLALVVGQGCGYEPLESRPRDEQINLSQKLDNEGHHAVRDQVRRKERLAVVLLIDLGEDRRVHAGAKNEQRNQ